MSGAHDHTGPGEMWSNLRGLTEINEGKEKRKGQDLAEGEKSGSIHLFL